MSEYRREVVIEIWNDTIGDFIVVRPDREGLDMVEVVYRDNEGRITGRLLFTAEQAVLVSQALLDCVDNNAGLRNELRGATLKEATNG